MLITGAMAAPVLPNAERRASVAISMYDHLRASGTLASSPCGIYAVLSSARLHSLRGDIIRKSGDILGAVEEFQLGRDEAQREGDACGAAICLSEIGITWERSGEHDRGAYLLRQAAAEAEACGEMQMAARWRGMAVVDAEGRHLLNGFNGLAFISARMRAADGPSGDDVIAIAKNIIFEAKGRNQPLLEAMARNVLAGLYAEDRKFHQALAQLKVAIQIVDDTNYLPG